MKKADKELLEMLFGPVTAAIMLEQAGVESDENASEQETKTADPAAAAYAEGAKEAKKMFDAFVSVGFTTNQATKFVAAILTK